MANPKINIASLDFDSIKASLKEYLNTKPEFAGYDFNGSALNTLLDVFAYNTLYYAFYSNLIANEAFLDTASLEENIISLLKPLGYLVTGRTSSRIQQNISPSSGTQTIIPYVDAFLGRDSSGNVYQFYALDQINLTTATDIVLYEGSSVVNNTEIAIDTTTQKAFLGTANIDVNTITVRVNGEEWTYFEDLTTEPNSNTKVFFIDRTSTGFYLVFGKKTINDYETSYGKSIEANDIVTVSYLIPSGEIANGISPASNSKVIVNSSAPSVNGTDSADLNAVKYFVPKVFAANNRTVTNDDYYGTLISSNLLPSGITSTSQINIWGGDDADPPAYGRLFVSFADASIGATNPSVIDCISFLNNRAILTVLPEYVRAQPVTATIDLIISGSPNATVSNITSTVQAYYNTVPVFNRNINIVDIKDVIYSNYSGVQNVSINDVYLTFSVFGSDGMKTLAFKNELTPGTPGLTGSSVLSSAFIYTDPAGTTANIRLGDTPRVYNTNSIAIKGNLVALNAGATGELTQFGILGNVDYANGYVSINENVIPFGTTISIDGYPRYQDTVTIKNELLLTTSITAS
jgi:hypothetical protein